MKMLLPGRRLLSDYILGSSPVFVAHKQIFLHKVKRYVAPNVYATATP